MSSFNHFRRSLGGAVAVLFVSVSGGFAQELTTVPDVVVSATRSEQSSVTIPGQHNHHHSGAN